MKTFFIVLLLLVVVVGLYVWAVLRQPAMGRLPTGARWARVQASPNFRRGAFQNLGPTSNNSNNTPGISILLKLFFGLGKRTSPKLPVPSVKSDLRLLERGINQVVWLGHASYFLWIDDKSYLVDPVLSGRASPVPFTVKAFAGTDIYTVDDLPPIDYLLITHDHWDHIDHPVIEALKEKVGRVITGLGTGEHFVRWGYDESQITELDWHESTPLTEGSTLHATPARHFSGRGLTRNQTLWLSFVLKTPSTSVFLGGDSGYGPHFKDIGRSHGPFDLAILENGQYNEAWPTAHCTPEQTLQASRDLKAKTLLPVHWGKFQLSTHEWDEPIIRLKKAHTYQDAHLLTPVIGEPVGIGMRQTFRSWWKGL